MATKYYPAEEPATYGGVGRLRVQVTSSVSGRSSAVTVRLQFYANPDYGYHSLSDNIKVYYGNSSGETYYGTLSKTLGEWKGTTGGTWTTIYHATFNVPHSDDGYAYVRTVAEGKSYNGWLALVIQGGSYYAYGAVDSGRLELDKLADITTPVTPSEPDTPSDPVTPSEPEEDDVQIPDVDIDWSIAGSTTIVSDAPAGGNPLSHLPYILYNGKPVPLGKTDTTRMIDEGLNNAGERCWTLFVYDGDEYPIVFRALGSASAGIDLFLCGGGGGGGDGTITDDDINNKAVGGGGGAGGCMKNAIGVTVERDTTYYLTVGAGGDHGEDGEETSGFNIYASGGLAGNSGYISDSGSTSTTSTSTTSDSTSTTTTTDNSGKGGAGTRSNTDGVSRAGGDGGIISDSVNTPPTNGKKGRLPFRASSLNNKRLSYKYLNQTFGSGGGGGTARYKTTSQTTPGEGGSDFAGRGGRSPTEGIVNHINGPLGKAGVANTGCGGGGGGCSDYTQTNGGKGGKGIIIIRNTRTPDVVYDGLCQTAYGISTKIVQWQELVTQGKTVVESTTVYRATKFATGKAALLKAAASSISVQEDEVTGTTVVAPKPETIISEQTHNKNWNATADTSMLTSLVGNTGTFGAYEGLTASDKAVMVGDLGTPEVPKNGWSIAVGANGHVKGWSPLLDSAVEAVSQIGGAISSFGSRVVGQAAYKQGATASSDTSSNNSLIGTSNFGGIGIVVTPAPSEVPETPYESNCDDFDRMITDIDKATTVIEQIQIDVGSFYTQMSESDIALLQSFYESQNGG